MITFCKVESCGYSAHSAQELEAHTGLVHEAGAVPSTVLTSEDQAIVDLARFLYETSEDAGKIFGLIPSRDNLPFEKLNEKDIKAFIATARAVRDRLLDPAKLGDAIEAHIRARVPGTEWDIEGLVKKIREL